ncbi:MAG TPA: GAF domain-containing protein, partial [Chloroflexia bacterium]|nr:GAF domain-containing protein [Chloroflexia bacterium]
FQGAFYMESNRGAGSDSALEQARALIARQQEELERLRARISGDNFAEELRRALTLAASVGAVATPVPHTRLLEMVVEVAAKVISARSASLFLIDEESSELWFEVALGPKAGEAKKFRVPLGHGIAGLVALTGQPMAVANAQDDPRQAADMAQSIGYNPQSILCVPLFYNDKITGVLELLDKEGAEAFSPHDMETLGLFANQAAVAIEQSRASTNIAALFSQVLASVGSGDAGAPLDHSAEARAAQFASAMEMDERYRSSLDLAALVREIAWQGEGEAAACRAILQGFAEYLRSRPGVVNGERSPGT